MDDRSEAKADDSLDARSAQSGVQEAARTGRRERPILFSGAMVRAILDGSKTQTRRVLGFQPSDILTPARAGDRALRAATRKWGDCRTWFALMDPPPASDTNKIIPFRCKHGEVGDRLWVRETWGWQTRGGGPLDDEPESRDLVYRADHPTLRLDRWRPSIHMPRAASRLTLEITAVRVERVQDITYADAVAEGLDARGLESLDFLPYGNPVAAFPYLWDSINRERGFGWAVNPWVWVVEFRSPPSPEGT